MVASREEELVEALDWLGRSMYERSAAFAEMFAEDAILIGSEAGEVARGRAAIRSLIAAFHALPARYCWAWNTIDARVAGDIGWLFAEGDVVREEPDGTQKRRPYRLSAVLARSGSQWIWLSFHGAEPAA